MKGLLSIFILFSIYSYAQEKVVFFNNGEEVFKRNIESFSIKDNLKKTEVFSKRFYKFIQFNNIPNKKELEVINNKGIKLLYYIPTNTYIASVSTKAKDFDFQNLDIRSIQEIGLDHKMSEEVRLENYPLWAIDGTMVELVIKTYSDIDFIRFKQELLSFGVKLDKEFQLSKTFIGKIETSKVKALAGLSCVQYVAAISEVGKAESNDGRNLHRSNAIDVDYFGGRKYNGEGVTVAINDDGFVGPHIDFTGRTNQLDVVGDLTGNHGDMTTGIIGGAGNLDPLMKGMATGSYIHVRQYTSTMAGTIPLHIDSSVLVFSSSYSNGCNGGYTPTTELVDKEIFDNYSLMQVFSAGNSNNSNCGYGAGSSWGNITGGHKIGKNVIAVANLENDDNIRASSSRGPASDGRIKPDLSAHGAGHMSTDPNNTYAPGGGTSAAAPGVAGVMAQLHHAYRSLNGTTANSGLLKATMLVTANDLGNEGPDFIFGWGKVNALKAVKLLEDNRFLSGSVGQGAIVNHTIFIPNNIKKARVMVYWVDKEASTIASQALVNDIDITVTDPTSSIHMPWILDHTPNPNLLALPATRGVDHLNNMEEVEINNPTSGNYTLSINGTTIPFGTQEYFIVYEFIEDNIEVVFPIGGEGFIPNTTERIHWDTPGTTGTFLIEYTDDDGLTWNTIQNNVSGSDRFYSWLIPNTVTGKARVRVSRAGSIGESYENFTIMNRPENLSIDRVCYSSSTIEFSWSAVTGATSYDVYLLGNKYMDSIGSTTALTFSIPVADVNASHWVSVRARGLNSAVSLRQIAVEQVGSNQGGCILSCSSDHDIGVQSILSPLPEIYICNDSTEVEVKVEIGNTGLFNESNFQVNYQYGSQPISSFNYTGNLAVGSSSIITFPPFYISSSNTELLKVWTSLSSDSTYCNDTLSRNIVISNSYTSLPLLEDFESNPFPSTNFTITNLDSDKTWENELTIGSDGLTTNATYVNNYSYNSRGEKDYLNLTILDLTPYSLSSSVNLTFDVAYRTYGVSYSDSLIVEVSSDCGVTFTPLYAKGGGSLSTGVNFTSSWDPTLASDWRNEQVDLSPYLGNKVFVRFVNICDYGQNLYLDNININVVGPPVAQFSYNVLSSCSKVVTFQDESNNNPTQWLWSFGDGVTSALQNPSHTYAATGTYNVKLQAINNYGIDSIDQVIEINEPISNFPMLEDFEENTTHSFLSRIINIDNNISWDSIAVVGIDGTTTNTVMINNYSYNDRGQEDVLEFKDFNYSSLQNLDSAYFFFDIAYRQYNNSYSDSLKVEISTDCGQTFSTIYYKGGDDISGGVDLTSSSWAPQTTSDWITDSVNISAYSSNSVIIRLVNICGYGQKLYLDNINVQAYGSYTAIKEIDQTHFDYTIKPNPAHDAITLLLEKELRNSLKASIFSLDGRLVKSVNLDKGEKEKRIEVSDLAPASYILQLESSDFIESKKIIVQ